MIFNWIRELIFHPDSRVALNLILRNNNFGACQVGAIGFFATGFGTSETRSLIDVVGYNQTILPGRSDTCLGQLYRSRNWSWLLDCRIHDGLLFVDCGPGNMRAVETSLSRKQRIMLRHFPQAQATSRFRYCN